MFRSMLSGMATIYDAPTPSRFIIDLSTGTVLANPTAFTVGTYLYMQDTDAFYENVLLAGNVQAWRPAGGAGNLPKYFVAPPTSATILGPVAPYTTISAAIAAAVADGHNAANPTVVAVYPGTYTETIALADGVFVVGMCSPGYLDLGLGSGPTDANNDPDVTIVGGVTLTATASVTGMRSINVQSAATQSTITLGTSAVVANVKFSECVFRAQGVGNQVLVGSPTSTPVVSFNRCSLLNITGQTGAAACINVSTACLMDIVDTSIQCKSGNDFAINAGAAQTIRMRGGSIFGEIVNVVGASTMTFEDVDLRVSGAGSVYISVTAGVPTVNWIRGNMSGAVGAPNLVGTFTFTRTGTIATDAAGLQIAAGVTLSVAQAPFGMIPKYVVGKPLTTTVFGPDAPYQTIGAAITAAANDGHTATVPATIFVYPGTYAELVTLKDGINIVAVGPGADMDLGTSTAATSYAPQVTFQGLALDAAFTSGSVRGCAIFSPGAGGGTIALGTNANAFTLHLNECQIRASGAGNVLLTGSPTATPNVTFTRCKMLSLTTQAGVAGLNPGTAVTFDLFNSSIECNAGTDTAINLGAAATLRMRQGTIFGNIVNVAGASALTFEDVDLRVTGATAYIAVTAGVPTVTWVRGNLSGSTAATNLTGTFTFARQGVINSDANGLAPATTVTFNINRSQLSLTARANGAGGLSAANFLLADVHTIDTTAAGRTVTLPAANTYPPGNIVYVAATQTAAGANAITFHPAGADTINGLNADMLTSADVKGSGALMRNPNVTTDWIMVSLH